MSNKFRASSSADPLTWTALVGLNPDTAAYTKAELRVRTYMIDHRVAVSEKLVDQEVDLSGATRSAQTPLLTATKVQR